MIQYSLIIIAYIYTYYLVEEGKTKSNTLDVADSGNFHDIQRKGLFSMLDGKIGMVLQNENCYLYYDIEKK